MSPGPVPMWRWVPFVMGRTQPRSALGRLVRVIGGSGPGSDAWVLPAGARPLLPDNAPGRTAAVRRRLSLAGAALFLAVGLGALAWGWGAGASDPESS